MFVAELPAKDITGRKGLKPISCAMIQIVAVSLHNYCGGGVYRSMYVCMYVGCLGSPTHPLDGRLQLLGLLDALGRLLADRIGRDAFVCGRPRPSCLLPYTVHIHTHIHIHTQEMSHGIKFIYQYCMYCMYGLPHCTRFMHTQTGNMLTCCFLAALLACDCFSQVRSLAALLSMFRRACLSSSESALLLALLLFALPFAP